MNKINPTIYNERQWGKDTPEKLTKEQDEELRQWQAISSHLSLAHEQVPHSKINTMMHIETARDLLKKMVEKKRGFYIL